MAPGGSPPHPIVRQGLYDPRNEHDACGVGMVAHIAGGKSHAIVCRALEILHNLDHRGASGAEVNTGGRGTATPSGAASARRRAT